MTMHIRFPKWKRKKHAKKNNSELDNNWELPARSRPTSASGLMAHFFRGNGPTTTEVGATDRPEDTTPKQQTPPPRKTIALHSKSPRDADELSVRQVPRWKDSSFRDSSPDGGNSPLFVTPLAAEGEGSIFPLDFDLDKRRELEEELVRKFDRPDINTHMGEFWFLVDARWMNSWVDFITGKAGPPGMITNYNLFNQRRPSTAEKHDAMMIRHAADYRRRGGVMANRPGLTLKKGLQKIRDYRALHPFTWYLFREMYTTDDAPEVCRWKADIYSPEVGVLHKKRVDQAIHIKASYEMRRFAARIKDMQRSPSWL